MTDDRWQEVDAMFRRALELPVDERAAFLAESCGDDTELQTALAELLEATDESDPFLEAAVEDLWDLPWDEVLPGDGSGDSEDPPARFDRSSERLGPWRLLRRLGRGGMATVYLAERADGQWEQRVAVKVLRRGLDTEDVVRRFHAERQILSSLDHPNIARLLDGGSTPDGLPYLVMEYVEGTPIHAYCDERGLSVEKRLELFCQAGRAVQGAHRHLVVHRDLKPSNILVDTRGRVKLLDFGIAKILDPTDAEPVTRTGLRPLTLAYASPEQVTGDAITTASDVYQLGLLLCELLSGRRPYEVRALSPARAERAVTEAKPAPPSSLVTEGAAKSRGTSPDDLARTLRGDLDTIALHALRREPDGRYESAGALVDDVRRFARGEPVTARPDTMGYRVRKFVGRHRAGVAAAVAVLVLLVGLATVALVQAERAERERNVARAEAAKAEEVKDVLVGLFESPDPYAPADPDRGRDIRVVEALELGADRARRELADRPGIQGEVLASIARVLSNLGQHERARAVAEDALPAMIRAHGDRSAEVASVVLDLARQAAELEEREAAETLFERALAGAEKTFGSDDPRAAPFHTAIGTFLQISYPDPGERARFHQERGVALYRAADPVPDGELSQALYKLADLYRKSGSMAEARNALDEALRLARGAYGSDHPRTAFVLASHAAMLSEEGRYAAAVAAFREAIEALEATLGEEHDFTLSVRNNLAVTLANSGDLEGAEGIYRRVIEDRVEAFGENHGETAGALQNLAANLNEQGRYEEAERYLERASTAFRGSLGSDHPRTAFPLLTQTEIRLGRGEHAGAERSAREAIAILSVGLPPDHWILAVAECRLGRALAGQGRTDEARPRIEEALRLLEAKAPPTARDRVSECRSARDELATHS